MSGIVFQLPLLTQNKKDLCFLKNIFIRNMFNMLIYSKREKL